MPPSTVCASSSAPTASVLFRARRSSLPSMNDTAPPPVPEPAPLPRSLPITDMDLVYVDPETKAVVGRVEWSRSGNPRVHLSRTRRKRTQKKRAAILSLGHVPFHETRVQFGGKEEKSEQDARRYFAESFGAAVLGLRRGVEELAHALNFSLRPDHDRTTLIDFLDLHVEDRLWPSDRAPPAAPRGKRRVRIRRRGATCRWGTWPRRRSRICPGPY